MTLHEVWHADYTKVCKALEDGEHIYEQDGEQFIAHSAPAHLVELYSRLRSIGYAAGWL